MSWSVSRPTHREYARRRGTIEREAIGERTEIALGHKRANLKAYVPTPFGYRRGGNKLIPNRSSKTLWKKA